MNAIAARFRDISQHGCLPIEGDRCAVEMSKDAVHEIERQWRLSGTRIENKSHRRQAFNIMLPMPRGTHPWWSSVRLVSSPKWSLPITAVCWYCTTTKQTHTCTWE